MSRIFIYPALILLGLFGVSSYTYFTAEDGYDCMKDYIESGIQEGCIYEITDGDTFLHIDECGIEMENVVRVGKSNGCFVTVNGIPNIMNTVYCYTASMYYNIGI